MRMEGERLGEGGERERERKIHVDVRYRKEIDDRVVID